MITPPEAKTERLVVMVSPREKQDIASRAKSQGMDTSEFVRVRCGANDPADDMAESELVALTESLNELASEAHTSLTEGLAALSATLTSLRRGKDTR